MSCGCNRRACGRCTRRRGRAFGALEASCSGKYSSLVTNGIGGTLDVPCGLYCNSADVEAWRMAADDMFFKVRRAWNQTAPSFTIPKPVIDYITALEVDYCTTDPSGYCVTFKLPDSSAWDITHNLKASLQISRWVARGACALELLDQVRGAPLPQEKPPVPVPQGPNIPIPNLGIGSSLPWIVGGLALLFMLRR